MLNLEALKKLRFEQQNLKNIVKMKNASFDKTKKPKPSKTSSNIGNENSMLAICLYPG